MHVVVRFAAVLVEDVLALDLDVVDLRLQDLLATYALLRLARSLIVLHGQVCPRAFCRLLACFYATLLLIAQDGVVLLICVEWRVIFAKVYFWFAERRVKLLVLECQVVFLLGDFTSSHEVQIYFFNDEFLVVNILTDFVPKGEGSAVEDLHVNVNAAFFKLTPKLLRLDGHIHCVYFEVVIPRLQ